MAYLLKRKLSVPNEVVLRSVSDDRRQIDKKKNANDIIYLGTTSTFKKQVSDYISSQILDNLFLKFEELKGSGVSMQKGTGILVKHIIDLNFFSKNISHIENYLNEFELLYRFPNFNKIKVLKELEKYLEVKNELEFYSDLVFISDNPPKPYFKWFRDSEVSSSHVKFDFVKQFLIPKLTFWNFKIVSFDNNELFIKWELSYSDIVIGKSKNTRKLYLSTKNFLIKNILANIQDSNDEDIQTLKDAITKIRLGQSKFRKDLLSSKRNECVFTKISDPKLLLAGHIKPWSISTNKERLDINNGILLTPTFDKLFDNFLISFDKNGKVIFSQKINQKIWKNLFPKFEEIKDIKITITDENKKYLDFHYSTFKIKS